MNFFTTFMVNFNQNPQIFKNLWLSCLIYRIWVSHGVFQSANPFSSNFILLGFNLTWLVQRTKLTLSLTFQKRKLSRSWISTTSRKTRGWWFQFPLWEKLILKKCLHGWSSKANECPSRNLCTPVFYGSLVRYVRTLAKQSKWLHLAQIFVHSIFAAVPYLDMW